MSTADLEAMLAAPPSDAESLSGVAEHVAGLVREACGADAVAIWIWRTNGDGVRRLEPLTTLGATSAAAPQFEPSAVHARAAHRSTNADGRCRVDVALGGYGMLRAWSVREFDDAFVERLHALAPQVGERLAGHLPRSELERNNRWLLLQGELDRRAATSLAGVRSVEELGRHIESLADELFPIEYSGVYFIDPRTNRLRLVYAKGLSEAERAAAERTAEHRHPGQVLRTGEAVDVRDTEAEPHAGEPPSHGRSVRSRLYLPVRVGGDVVGSIGFASSRPGSFGTQHQQALRFLCDLAGVTYARLQAQQEIERRGQLIEATATANERLLSALEWRQAATAALALVGNALDVAALALVKLEQDERAEQVDFVWQPLFGAPWRYRDRVARLEREERDKLARGLGVVITTARGDGDAPCTVECKPVLVDGVLWGVIACEATLGRAERAALRWLANGFAATIMRERMDRELRERHKVEAVSRLASGIAHDFNNLLWPVLLYSEILERGPGLDDRARQMLRDMCRSATRASELVQQVFAVSRSRDRVLQVVDVPEIAIEVAATARRSSPTAVHIVSTIDNDAGHVLGDEDSVRQLLQHLLAQSLDAASSADERAASGVIRLSVERLERDRGSWIRIVVRDESQAPAEDPIGMAIVRRLSTELGGEMTCERSAAGSVRELLLPIALREPSAPAEPEPTIDELVARANPTPSPDAERVLLVDDDAAVLEVARQILESLGYEVVACDTPERALTVLGDGALPLALLLTDLSMPGMDGIGLARECRRLRPQLPIVFCTGFGDTRSERAARELGAAAFIRKPIDFDHYAKTIRAAIEGSPRG
jgi:CheY-like chemotaxis protein/signal transduction histidine kinase